MGDFNNEYRQLLGEMLRELDGGHEPDQKAMEGLRTASKMLAHCGNQESRKRKRKPTEEKPIKIRAATAIWRNVLSKHISQKMVEERSFQRQFTMDGKKGYTKFLKEIRDATHGSVDKEESLTLEGKKQFQADLEKPNGWIFNIITNMSLNLWTYLEENLTSSQKIEILGRNPGFYTHKKQLLEDWSKQLGVAHTGANVNYGNKMVQIGDLGIQQGAKHGTRPSRCIPGLRSLHFLKPEQIKYTKKIGAGVQGDIGTCHVYDCTLIQDNVILVAKKFKEGDKHKRRNDALQEMLMGGLNHKGIVGALAITIEDPPRLVYDYYNGGNLHEFIGKIELFNKGKMKAQDVDSTFISEKKVFLENRLGIALGLLETMAALHAVNRIHADLHFANILLHFDYSYEKATKVYVGICDFGMSMHLSQSRLPEKAMWPTSIANVKTYRENHPHLAPELVGPKPATWSKATDIYALGNIFETLLQVEDDWDGMGKHGRILSMGWDAKFNSARLDEIIGNMMSTDVKMRHDCNHWIMQMTQYFPNCNLRLQNSPYLRD